MNYMQSYFGAPIERVKNKRKKVVCDWLANFVKMSSFLVMSVLDKDGEILISPRGGKPGFISILDNNLIIPEYKGNNLFEISSNLNEVSKIGLILFIPGINESVRVIGSAKVVLPHENLYSELDIIYSEDCKKHVFYTLISIHEWYYHCAKSIKNGKVWDCDFIVKNSSLRNFGKRPRVVVDN